MKTNIKQRLTNIYRVAILVFVATALTLPSLVPATARAAANNTQGTTTTNNALAAVNSATDIAGINIAMNSFLGQYGLTFSDQCGQTGYCENLTSNEFSLEKTSATNFIESFSVINTALVAATQLTEIRFVTKLRASIGIAGGVNLTSSIYYNVEFGLAPVEAGLVYHEFGHSVGYLIQNDSALRNQWLSYNVPDLPLLDNDSSGWNVYDKNAIGGYCTENVQYCRVLNPTYNTYTPYGFISLYAYSTLQEDYGETFAAMFTDAGAVSRATLAQQIPNDPYLGSKVELMRNVIKTADPTTDEGVYGYASLPVNTDIPQPEEDPTEEEQQPTDDTIIIRSGETRTIDNTVNNVIVEGGGTLKGTGTIHDLLVQSSGEVEPGHSPGCLTITGSYTLQGIFRAELGGDKPCSGYDQIITNAAVNLNDSTLDATNYQNGTFTIGQQFMILKNNATQPVTGTFTNLSEGSLFQVGNYLLSVSYQGGDGNDVVLTVKSLVPSAPNTGFTLIRNNPLATIATLFTAGTAILVLNRKLKLQRRWS